MTESLFSVGDKLTRNGKKTEKDFYIITRIRNDGMRISYDAITEEGITVNDVREDAFTGADYAKCIVCKLNRRD